MPHCNRSLQIKEGASQNDHQHVTVVLLMEYFLFIFKPFYFSTFFSYHKGLSEYSVFLHSYLSWMDALNLCLHIVEASNGCLHLIQLKQMGNMTHLLTCAHNHKMLVSAKKIEKLKMQLKIARQ